MVSWCRKVSNLEILVRELRDKIRRLLESQKDQPIKVPMPVLRKQRRMDAPTPFEILRKENKTLTALLADVKAKKDAVEATLAATQKDSSEQAATDKAKLAVMDDLETRLATSETRWKEDLQIVTDALAIGNAEVTRLSTTANALVTTLKVTTAEFETQRAKFEETVTTHAGQLADVTAANDKASYTVWALESDLEDAKGQVRQLKQEIGTTTTLSQKELQKEKAASDGFRKTIAALTLKVNTLTALQTQSETGLTILTREVDRLLATLAVTETAVHNERAMSAAAIAVLNGSLREAHEHARRRTLEESVVMAMQLAAVREEDREQAEYETAVITAAREAHLITVAASHEADIDRCDQGWKERVERMSIGRATERGLAQRMPVLATKLAESDAALAKANADLEDVKAELDDTKNELTWVTEALLRSEESLMKVDKRMKDTNRHVSKLNREREALSQGQAAPEEAANGHEDN